MAAVVIGVVAVLVVLLGSGDDDYTYKARFINASQLVNGDQIRICDHEFTFEITPQDT